MKNWVILFARTGSEEKVDGTLKSNLNAEEFLPFVPVKEMAYRRKGVVHRIRKPLFPGYIFIQTDIEPELVADKLEMALKNIGGNKHIYSMLHYGDDKKTWCYVKTSVYIGSDYLTRISASKGQ